MLDNRTSKGRLHATRYLTGVAAACAGALVLTAGAGEARAQFRLLELPDLTVSVSGPASVPAGTSATFLVTIRNVATWRTFCFRDPVTRQFICDTFATSSEATGVRVDFALPGFTVTAAASPGGGFTCFGGATCTGGQLMPDDAITIPITAVAGPTAGTFGCNATADPLNAVSERVENNNGAACSVAITPLPDLDMFGSAPPTFQRWMPVTFDLTVANLGGGAASNITITMFTNLPAALSSATIGGGFACNAPSQFGQALQFNCWGGSLPASSTAQLRIAIKLLANSPSGTPFTLFGFLDLANTIPESDETNNNFTIVSHVQ